MGYFRKQRNVELSTLDFITAQIQANWSGITVVKTFQQAAAAPLPVVCVRITDTRPERKELGDNELRYTYDIAIDIFAKSDGQRLDISDFLIEALRNGWTYYEYSQNSGNPEVLDKVENGMVQFDRVFTSSKVLTTDNTVNHEKFRHLIYVTARKS